MLLGVELAVELENPVHASGGCCLPVWTLLIGLLWQRTKLSAIPGVPTQRVLDDSEGVRLERR